ncbi:MAG TPA: 2,3,4,5-tetrahydropyridine-2,6-dicarboxylate N-succinyltransferase [Caulobacteraceae bacterium]|jgi:2,3,4,5-tetrahydropyridine-2-carboxylate N-succinyltransferase|nr:2,3,4,5-tetrahydropyridine-2,6-dicarboxylate N-succinyltransferase [Caulobacteraceae bacterium]
MTTQDRLAQLEHTVDEAWEKRDAISDTTTGFVRESIMAVIDMLDLGQIRVAEKIDGEWVTRQWLKKAVLMSFRLRANSLMVNGGGLTHETGLGPWWDKVPGKCADWTAADFARAGFRSVPGAVARRGAFIARNVVLMPSFVNIGAYVDEGTMVDTWATVGSCAQIGKHVHISGGAGIGGVLEPLQANPTIIEDNCFIGARSEVAEGVIVGEGAVLSMGVFISGSTKIIDRKTGEVHRGRVPPYSVVAPGTLPDPYDASRPSLACAVIVKTVDAQTRSKTSPNELLRDA